MRIEVSADRLSRAKRAFTTRNIPASALILVSSDTRQPKAGDVVLARVKELGQHRQIELPTSRKATMFVGDEVLLVYGNRYAPDQFEALVPDDLGPCDMVAAGGVAGRVVAQNVRMKIATAIEPIGVFIHDDGAAINVADFALRTTGPKRKIPGIAVVGGSMNAGKTTTAAALVRGLMLAGYKVGAAKITGTGAGNDSGLMRDAGASWVYDFTDAGLVTTYKASHFDLERCATTLAAALTAQGADVMVFEIADGLFQQETAWLVQNSTALRKLVDGYLYAGESAASVASGVHWLRQHGALLGVSGVVSQSPLACREIYDATGFPCLTRDELATSEQAEKFLGAIAAFDRRVAA